jgi:hypothetical protein
VVFAFGLDTFGKRKSGVSSIVHDRVVCVDVGAPSGCYNVYADSEEEITSTIASHGGSESFTSHLGPNRTAQERSAQRVCVVDALFR